MAGSSMFFAAATGKTRSLIVQSHVDGTVSAEVEDEAVIDDRGFEQRAVEHQPGRPVPVHGCTKTMCVWEREKARYSVVTLASMCAFCSRDLYFWTSSRAWLSRTSVALWLLACCFWPRLIESNSYTYIQTHADTYIHTHAHTDILWHHPQSTLHTVSTTQQKRLTSSSFFRKCVNCCNITDRYKLFFFVLLK